MYGYQYHRNIIQIVTNDDNGDGNNDSDGLMMWWRISDYDYENTYYAEADDDVILGKL